MGTPATPPRLQQQQAAQKAASKSPPSRGGLKPKFFRFFQSTPTSRSRTTPQAVMIAVAALYLFPFPRFSVVERGFAHRSAWVLVIPKERRRGSGGCRAAARSCSLKSKRAEIRRAQHEHTCICTTFNKHSMSRTLQKQWRPANQGLPKWGDFRLAIGW